MRDRYTSGWVMADLVQLIVFNLNHESCLAKDVERELLDDFATFFDSVVIPAKQKLGVLDPRVDVSVNNASKLHTCAANELTARIVEADRKVIKE